MESNPSGRHKVSRKGLERSVEVAWRVIHTGWNMSRMSHAWQTGRGCWQPCGSKDVGPQMDVVTWGSYKGLNNLSSERWEL